MSREIKYRQLDHSGKWHYWGWYQDEFRGPLSRAMSKNGEGDQYTGLKDKNEVKIFENDLLLYHGAIAPVQVVWDEHNAGFVETQGGEFFDIDGCEDAEVIGNIHQNPELLDDQAR